MSLNVLIIGAVAAGPKAGCRIKRLEPDANVTMLDRDNYISYGGCGIPYYVSGDVADLKGLLSTSFHMVRDPQFFKGAKGVDVQTGVEALAIDRAAKKVRVKDLASGHENDLAYDKLVLATGARPFTPPIAGANLQGVWPVGDLHHAQAIKHAVAQGGVGAAAIIGAGATGLEMAEALADLWGVEVHIIERQDQFLLGVLDPDIARMLQTHMAAQDGVSLHLGADVGGILADDEGKARAVVVDGQEIAVDMVIMATGVRPNDELARAAGLELAQRGGIKVNERMQTSDPDIYAAGDCVSVKNILSGKDAYVPAGSLANRMGRVVGTNVCGGQATFPGVLGSFCIKLFGLSAARTGLNEVEARAMGLDVVAPLVVQADRAHFHPDMAMMYVKLVVEKNSRRLLGLSALGDNGDAVVGRVNAMAGLLAKGGELADLSNLELAYSPPLGAAMDILNTAANVAENMIEGRLRSIAIDEFAKRLASDDSCVIVDVRAIDNAGPYLEQLAPKWRHLPQETIAGREGEVPQDRDVLLICNSGARSYEAMRQLAGAGVTNTYNVGGGVAAVKKWGEPILAPKDEN
ncbi:FAD-dependent pyridine nucleotide-disulfide oxidoreductase [Desulfarculus baarsii DSM 2075]|uniref:FAD-dependent pyridine nucleotide-disulfide oxidoreductase n=1 Tax=Desulfarculus baarsii (strain ATCC 33931 / DSM 2075 / LMG 7858 / VKM B-1802 / 2st14) TaxID=644282 RepID=E1QJ21_DESB2|nr:FAD-dependent oxidoreductase [Desulfarculus baarsii]ADK85564.1 FAD-dependent pyridine nucleotide-disulfide oxidoreductase [Desulfarculus baarsii DSM 2075]